MLLLLWQTVPASERGKGLVSTVASGKEESAALPHCTRERRGLWDVLLSSLGGAAGAGGDACVAAEEEKERQCVVGEGCLVRLGNCVCVLVT